MKKYLIVFAFMLLLSSGCSRKETSGNIGTEEGIAPYELSEGEQNILDSFGMGDTSKLISFLAPINADSIEVNVYRLTGADTWERIGNGAMSLGIDREPEQKVSGTIAIELKENYRIDFYINGAGQGHFTSKEIRLEEEPAAETKCFLNEFQQIELNKEIPIALRVYDSGTNMRSYQVQDYGNPSVFRKMDLVQAVTVTFSDKESGE